MVMIPILCQRAICLHALQELVFIVPFHSFSSLTTNPNLPSASLHSVSRKKLFVVDYLIKNFDFTEARVMSLLKRIPGIETTERPDSVVSLFQQYGFSHSDTQKIVRVAPLVLFLDPKKILKPKLDFLQQLGFSGPELGRFLSKSPSVLTVSLEHRLMPSVAILCKFLSAKDLIRVMNRCKWIVKEDPNMKLLPNITFLRHCCGIVDSQFTMLLVRQPLLFVKREDSLRALAQKTIEMGFPMSSRMFVYGLYTMSCLNSETLKRKLDFMHSHGFSADETKQILRKAPAMLRTSLENLKLKLDFYLNEVGFEKFELVRYPSSLAYSLDKRIAPRYRVLQILKSKKMLKPGTKMITVLNHTEKNFLKMYVLRFEDDAAELLSAYQPGVAVPASK